jgi:hypothetical protein
MAAFSDNEELTICAPREAGRQVKVTKSPYLGWAEAVETKPRTPDLPVPEKLTADEAPALLPDFLTPRMVKFFLMPVVLLTAFYTKEYTGAHQQLINNHVGGVFYVLFGSLAFSYLFRRLKTWQAVSAALVAVSLLEAIPWFRFPFLTHVTSIPLLSFLLGNSFNPVDFIYYGIGTAAGGLILWILDEKKAESQL